MHRQRLLIPLASMLLLVAALPAVADLPPDRSAAYTLRLEPDNEISAIIFRVEFELTAADQDGDTVGCQVVSAHFSETDSNGAAVRSWTVLAPDLATADGLWWVSHADGENPQTTEFANVPEMSGTAAADAALDPDLDYDLAQAVLAPEHASMYSGAVTAVAHRFKRVGDALPLTEGEDEPTEVGGTENP